MRPVAGIGAVAEADGGFFTFVLNHTHRDRQVMIGGIEIGADLDIAEISRVLQARLQVEQGALAIPVTRFDLGQVVNDAGWIALQAFDLDRTKFD